MTEITIDIDIPFASWNGSQQNLDWLDRFYRVMDKHAFFGKSALYIRRSAQGRVHYKIVTSQPVTFGKELQIRAHLDDDPSRIAGDLERFYLKAERSYTGRCFDEKFIHGHLFKAGEWKQIWP